MKTDKNKWKPHKLVGKSNLMFAFGILFALMLTLEQCEGYRWLALAPAAFAIITDYITIEK